MNSEKENKDKRLKVAIVTGASSGLGIEFVRLIDSDFDVDEIWMVARRLKPMQAIKESLSRAKGVPMEAALDTPEGVAFVRKRIKESNPDLRVLVNNAGVGMYGRFDELDLDAELRLLDLNVRALTELTHVAIPYMSEGSIIVQVSSMVGFFPVSGWAVYAASKAYVLSLGTALAGELKSKKINCVVCAPGSMKTEFYDTASSDKNKANAFSIAEVNPSKVAALALADGKRGKLVSVKGVVIKMLGFFSRFVPRGIFVGITRRMLNKDQRGSNEQ